MVLVILKFRSKQIQVLGTYSDALAACRSRQKQHSGRGVIFPSVRIERLLMQGWSLA